MKQVKFNELDLKDKLMLLSEFGHFLGSVEYYDYWVHLYAINSHFFEVWYNIEYARLIFVTFNIQLMFNNIEDEQYKNPIEEDGLLTDWRVVGPILMLFLFWLVVMIIYEPLRYAIDYTRRKATALHKRSRNQLVAK